ncbi:MAG: TIGR04024 family LLM class F420-dependent oxidoreductase [Haloarculaceae archaeon]
MPVEDGRDVVLPLGEFDDLADAVSLTQFAEDLGYGYVTMGETTGRNVALVLSVLAANTTEIGITDNVLSPYSRTPSLLGQTAVTLQEISGGRFRLRLGASSPALAERWHGVDYDRPIRQLRESIEIIRQVQSGERLDYDGEFFSPGGLKLECPTPDPPVPVDVAALGPKSTEMTGRFADGWVPQLIPLDGLDARMDDLRRGADLGGRSIDDVRVAHTLRCCATDDGSTARSYARSQVAFMIARYGPYYRQAIADAGWESVTETVSERWQDGDREEAVAAVPDALLDELVAAGTPDEVREQVERFEALDGVDAIQVGFFGQMSRDEQEQTLTALAPE